MNGEYTRYFAELCAKNKKPEVWYPHDKIGEESLDDARDQLDMLKRHFSANFTFRIVKRDYVYKETIIE